jgi:hypothetical protein
MDSGHGTMILSDELRSGTEIADCLTSIFHKHHLDPQLPDGQSFFYSCQLVTAPGAPQW